jgi:hypothetical protein
MTSTGKLKSSLVDMALIVGLMLAVAGVYNVETRLPRAKVDAEKDGYEEKVVIETGLSGTTKRSTYVLRTRKDKAKWVAQFGGSPQTEGCVQDGMPWRQREQPALEVRAGRGMHNPRRELHHGTDRACPAGSAGIREL